ncbi:hypothetical protein C2S52_017198 [Perilla frutescens var. hirtella]|nr:hypothetical protein C2S52_017198 [Perilla frutescens var. hirtella]
MKTLQKQKSIPAAAPPQSFTPNAAELRSQSFTPNADNNEGPPPASTSSERQSTAWFKVARTPRRRPHSRRQGRDCRDPNQTSYNNEGPPTD